ncbi:MAG: hypothetical protein K2X97_01810 [Mycobacteriaceae bacterium]|nr:hypothetical protein [Mycobacteriaceae bacterium]
MAKRGVAAEMRKHAEAAAEMVLAEYGHRLDFSEPTIGAVESILNGFWTEGDLTDDLAANITLLFGSYIGELIREAFPEAKWVRGESSPDSAGSPYIQLDDIKLFPVTWCYKRLYNGPDDSVVKKYLAFREVIDARSE